MSSATSPTKKAASSSIVSMNRSIRPGRGGAPDAASAGLAAASLIPRPLARPLQRAGSLLPPLAGEGRDGGTRRARRPSLASPHPPASGGGASCEERVSVRRLPLRELVLELGEDLLWVDAGGA